MPVADYVPHFNDGSISTYYRNVLGVPVRKRVIIAVLSVLVLLLVIVGAIVYANRRQITHESREVSVLPYVKIASSVNLSVDPCVNFYDFACGSWSEDELVANDEDLTLTFNTLDKFVTEKKKQLFLQAQISDNLPRVVNDALQFYHTCMSLSEAHDIEIQYLMKYLKQVLGGWPILNADNWDGTNFKWIDVSAHLLRTLHVQTILKVSTIVDDYNPNHRVLYISPPVFEETSLSDFGSFHVLASVFKCLNHSDVKIKNVKESVEAIRDTETKWLEYFSLKSGLNQNRTRMTVGDMRKKMPNFDWLGYVQLVLNYTNDQYSENDIVYVDNFEFLNGAISKFESESFSKFELANLFGWFILQKTWFIVPGAVRLYSELFDSSEEEIRENSEYQCWQVVNNLHVWSIDYLFVQNISHFGLQDGDILLKNIKHVLEGRINQSDWLDDSTKSSAVDKLKSMTSVIGFKKYLANKSEFDKLNKNFPSFSSCVMQAYFEIQTYFTFIIANDIKFHNFTNLVTSRPVTDVSAYYSPQKNVLTIPLSMFNPPFYYYDSPWYLNFGGIGSIIAHEVMHAFDSISGKRDKTGALRNWWSNSALEEYRQRSECFETQYNAYKNPVITNNHTKSVGEDISDSEGLHLAYLAYMHWIKANGSDPPYLIKEKQFSPEQTFFIAFASVWCSKQSHRYSVAPYSRAMYRVTGAISNSEDFSLAFNCPVDSPMNPHKKCHIW